MDLLNVSEVARKFNHALAGPMLAGLGHDLYKSPENCVFWINSAFLPEFPANSHATSPKF
jgi:hypothetical protein